MDRILNTIFFGVAILFLAFLIFKSGEINISDINPTVLVSIIAGMVTFSGYFITRSFERQKLIDQQIREQKLPVYEDFVTFILDAVINQNLTEEQMISFFSKFNQKSIVWLSDKSFKAYVEWAKALKDIDPLITDRDPMINLLLLEKLFFEFRLDIGHKNSNFEKGDILSLFINDLHKFDLKAYK